MARYEKNRKNKSRKPLLILASFLIISAVIVSILFKNGTITWPFSNTDISTQDNINYGPPTEEEVKSGDEKKETITQTEQATPVVASKPDTETTPPSNQGSNLSMIISDASQYDNDVEVRAFIPNHFENGTCSMTFKLNSSLIVKQVAASADATSTICANLIVARAEFSEPGAWILTVKYESPNGNTATASQEVVIQ